MNKRILTLLLTVAMLLSLIVVVPMSVSADMPSPALLGTILPFPMTATNRHSIRSAQSIPRARPRLNPV